MKQKYFTKILVLLSMCLGGKMAFAQTFEQVLPPPPAPQIIANFKGVQNSSIAFADIDNDNDLDVLITGADQSYNPIAKLYENDGSGSYTEVTETPFEGVQNGSIAFADVDGDDDQDVLITGSSGGMDGGLGMGGESIAKLYFNDGSGNFAEAGTSSFMGVGDSSIAFADVNGDGDQDVLITGFSGSQWERVPSSNLYLNDGDGNFLKANNTSFAGVGYSSIAFADVDGDEDQDVLITGTDDNYNPIAKLYENDGSGIFSEVAGMPFTGVYESSLAFADVDDDGHQEVLITGMDTSGIPIAKLYENDGNGIFSENTANSFAGVFNSSLGFADVDGDGDQDVLITGRDGNYNSTARLYKNDGSGNYSEATNTSFAGVQNGSLAFADVDGDSHQDVLITGDQSSTLYINNGAGNFLEAKETPFAGVIRSSVAFADIDGDNDQDVLLTGMDKSNRRVAKLYANQGGGNYLEATGTPLAGVHYGSIAFADIDGDNDQDVLLTGEDNSGYRIAKLYENDGEGTYEEVTGLPFQGVEYSSIAFADVNGDGDQDVLVTGDSGSPYNSIAKLYENDGKGTYAEVTGTPFEGVEYGSIAFADIDEDGDQDVLVTGYNDNSRTSIAKLYENVGNGSYSEVTGTPFIGVSNPSIAFADVDGNGTQDVLITGRDNSRNLLANLYLNDGSGNFTEATNNSFAGVYNGSIAFADVDGDNDQDVLLTGSSANYNEQIAILYMNDGTGNYTEVTGLPFTGVRLGSIAFADIDGDNDQDVLITGSDGDGPSSIMYRNTSVATTPPAVNTIIISNRMIFQRVE